jgi:hypothetical protein
MMNLNGFERKPLWRNFLTHYTGIRLEGLKKTEKPYDKRSPVLFISFDFPWPRSRIPTNPVKIKSKAVPIPPCRHQGGEEV